MHKKGNSVILEASKRFSRIKKKDYVNLGMIKTIFFFQREYRSQKFKMMKCQNELLTKSRQFHLWDLKIGNIFNKHMEHGENKHSKLSFM